jgi:precorrin-6B methylase 2
MASRSRKVVQEVARVLDTSSAELVADIGGASGTMAVALLEQNSRLKGVILELPEVAPHARAAVAQQALSHRCQVVEGDFFEAVPEADIHILKWIIHDWNDEQSVRILSNCVRALPRNGRVVLIEYVLSEDASSDDAALLDLAMLVTMPGRERTARQYEELMRQAGLRIDRFVDLDSSMQLIEASAAGIEG